MTALRRSVSLGSSGFVAIIPSGSQNQHRFQTFPKNGCVKGTITKKVGIGVALRTHLSTARSGRERPDTGRIPVPGRKTRLHLGVLGEPWEDIRTSARLAPTAVDRLITVLFRDETEVQSSVIGRIAGTRNAHHSPPAAATAAVNTKALV